MAYHLKSKGDRINLKFYQQQLLGEKQNQFNIYLYS